MTCADRAVLQNTGQEAPLEQIERLGIPSLAIIVKAIYHR
jgi:hypothetical protein